MITFRISYLQYFLPPRLIVSKFSVFDNKPRTAKVGAISKAQNLKGGPFGLCETPAGCKKILKNQRGDPLET